MNLLLAYGLFSIVSLPSLVLIRVLPTRAMVPLSYSLSLGVLGYFWCRFLLPRLSGSFLEAGLYGIDLNKPGKQKIPESQGTVTGTIFLVLLFLFQFTGSIDRANVYNAGLTCICFMLFLGLIDDVLNLRWRYKVVLPSFATLPLLSNYDGSTKVLIPKPFSDIFFIPILDLGYIYFFYMYLMGVFCSNAINIFAGINGLEVGQSLIIAFSLLFHNFLQISIGDPANYEGNLFSAVVLLPFIGTSLALMHYNWYPSRVFVGDSYTYSAGMTFAVVGILGHFTKTMSLMFLPQFLNFFLSLPQLLHILPCPRHRLPVRNEDTGLLHATPNLNMVNVTLYVLGPMKESTLTLVLVSFQAVCCAVCYICAFNLSSYLYF